MEKEGDQKMGKHEKKNQNDSRIDFSNPPEGFSYAEMPITRDMIAEWELNPELIIRKRIGRKSRLCYMCLVPIAIAKEYNNLFRNEVKKEDRLERCMIPSPKTGRVIRCPDRKSCIGCPLNDAAKRCSDMPLSAEALEENGFPLAAPGNLEEDVVAEQTKLEILAELTETNRKLADIFQKMIEGAKPAEIGKELGIAKSTMYDDIKKIRAVAEKHM